MFALSPGVECYLARVDGKLRAAGRWRFATGGRTVWGEHAPAFRNGDAGALLHARLERAAEAGCDLACAWRIRELFAAEPWCGEGLRCCIRASSLRRNLSQAYRQVSAQQAGPL